MKKAGQREIVVEFETVRSIRRRTRSTIAICPECGSESDLVSISAAAELFGIRVEELSSFADANGVHRQIDEMICVRSLLSAMNRQKFRKEIRMISSGAIPDQN
jgi:hypothetical protein